MANTGSMRQRTTAIANDAEKLIAHEGKRSESKTPTLSSAMSSFSVYLHSLFWCLAAVLVWIYGDVYRVIESDTRVNRPFLYVGFAGISLLLGCIFYMSFCLGRGKPISELDFERDAPQTILIGAISAVFTYLAFLIALWPVWRFSTILIVTIFGIAALFSTNFLPPY